MLACNRCEALTMHLPWDDARKFATSTPSQLQRTMGRVWKTSPSSRRVVQGVFRTVTNREHSVAHGPRLGLHVRAQWQTDGGSVRCAG